MQKEIVDLWKAKGASGYTYKNVQTRVVRLQKARRRKVRPRKVQRKGQVYERSGIQNVRCAKNM
jgi:hypothetical protein